MLVGLDIPTL